jgi:hypothetical protein
VLLRRFKNIAIGYVSLILIGIWAFAAFAEVQPLETRIWRRGLQIPAGQQTWSMQTAYRRSTGRFSANGTLQPLGARYDRATTWRRLIENESSAQGKAEINQYIKNQNIDPDSVAAISEYKVVREETIMQFGWAYGLTRNWMVGIDLPLTWSVTKVSSQVQLTPTLQNLVSKAQTPNKVRARVAHAASQELSNSGYDQVPDQKQVLEPGDISILNQQTLMRSYSWSWALQEMIRLPTSRNQSAFEYIQLSRDEGQLDVGLTSVIARRWRKLLVDAKASYVAQAPDTVKINRQSPTAGSSEVDPKVHRDLGDWVSVGFDTEYQWARRWNLSGGYSYLNKGRDHYSGEYDRFAENTDQETHMSRLGFEYIIDYGGARQGVEDKWQLSVNYYRPLAARNSTDGDRSALELTGYF